MKNIIEVIKKNGVGILTKSAIAAAVIAGLTIASKTLFAKATDDEENYEEIDETTNDEDDEKF